MSRHTHFVYLCRTCKREVLEPITWPDPAATPTPKCCKKQVRDMAFVGARVLEENHGQG